MAAGIFPSPYAVAPFAEAQVVRDDDASSFVKFASLMEQGNALGKSTDRRVFVLRKVGDWS